MPKQSAKYLEVRKKLLSFIKGNPAGAKLPSYPEMIRQFKVSQATIDKALTEFDEGKLIERRKGSGLFIAKRAKVRNIGLIFGRDIFSERISPIYRIMLGHLQKRAETLNHRYSFFIDLPEVEAKGFPLKVSQDLADALESRRLDGALLIPPRGPNEIRWLAGFKIPLAVLSNRPGPCAGVSFDVASMVKAGVERLAELGCRRVALATFSGHQRDQGFFGDLERYAEAIEKCGLEKDSSLIWDSAPKPPEDKMPPYSGNENLGSVAIDALLKGFKPGGKPPFDGLICTDDMGTCGIIESIRSLGLAAGKDFKMVSHANKGSNALRGCDENLELMEFDAEEMAEAMLSLLDRMLDGEAIAQGSVHCIQPTLRPAAQGETK